MTDMDFKQWLGDRPDGDYIVEVDTEGNKTSSQLGYYFGSLISLVMKARDCTKAKADYHMRIEFLEVVEMTHRDKVSTIVPSLKDLSKTEMSKFIDNVFEFCVTYGLNPRLQQEY